jgi:arsenate reductase-like glutaredoxin family protein
VEERLYFKQKATPEEVRQVASLLPGGARDLLSTRSRKYKEMGLDMERLAEDQLVWLLSEEPGLWRRPVVIRGRRAVVGFDAAALEGLLQGADGA